MPLKPPQAYELDRSESPLMSKRSTDEDDSDLSEVEELDLLKSSKRAYTDDASQPIRSVFDSTDKRAPSFTKKPLAWLDGHSRRQRQRLKLGRKCCIALLAVVAVVVMLLSAGGMWVYKGTAGYDGQSEPWYPSPKGGTVESWKEAYRKAAALVEQMTLVEKVNITTGIGWSMGMCVGNTGPVDRLGFPSLCLQDGPLGLRFAGDSTAWPAGVTVGATWNPELMYLRGKGHGFEAKKKGVNVILGPSMGAFGRIPAGGRNWEGFGPDPVLQGVAAAQTIKGIQDAGVMATAKHYIANEQEHFRQVWEWGTPAALSSNIDDRTLHEIYAWPFADSVRAGVASVMCSYNQVNNSYACQNSKLLNGVLKDELGFQGFVQSDWLAQRSGVAGALAGLDMTMPGDGLGWMDGKSLWGPELTRAVLNTSVPVERLNDMTLRIVAAWYQLGQDDKTEWPSLEDGGGPNFSSWTDDEVGQLHPGSPDSKETGVVNKFVPVRQTEEGGNHDALARKIAAEGTVLVKNDDKFLPLQRDGGDLKAAAGDRKVKVGIFGDDAFHNPAGDNACADRACNEGTLAMGWGSGAVELPYLVAPADALHANFDHDVIDITEWKTNDIADIEPTAREQDLCFAFISSDAGEGFVSWNGIRGDRNDLYVQKGGDELVRKVAAACHNTIVVLHTVGPTLVEKWIDLPSVKAVLIAHLPGQESGNALTDLLFGDVNPSGHLPYTLARRAEDYGPGGQLLYFPNGITPQQNFTEGLYVDYRYFDKHDIAPRYEFGYGLSYSDFGLSSLMVHPLGISGQFPKPRPEEVPPPSLSQEIPDYREALPPKGFRRLQKYVYPYLDSINKIDPTPYKYPVGYSSSAHDPSQAGGEQGGNPDLYSPAASVQATLTNLGPVPGQAVVQLYVSFPENVTSPSTGEEVDMPVRVLRGFQKKEVGVDAGEQREKVEFTLTRRDLSFWDTGSQNWVLPKGEFTVGLGFSSRDIRLTGSVDLDVALQFGIGP